MKKIIAGAAMILIVAAAFAPFINGLVMEKIVLRFQNDLNEMYADTGSGVTVEILAYDRGFSSSEIEWKIHFGSLAAVYGIDEILLVERADHGYTGVVSKTGLEKNQWFMDLINDKLEGKNPLHITTTYTLTGKIESIIGVDAFSFRMDNEIVDVRPARFITECNKDFTHFSSAATWQGLSAADRIMMDGFSLASDLQKISTYIWDGEITYNIKNIRIDDQEKSFALSNFQGEYILDYDKDRNTLSTGGAVRIDNLSASNENIRDMFIRIDVNNLDARGYDEFMQLYTRSVHSMLEGISRAEDDPAEMEKVMRNQAAAAGFQMMAAYEKFLKKGLEIRISDLRATLSEGEITGNAAVQLNRDVTFAQLAAIAAQPGLAFETLSLTSNLSFPAPRNGDDPRLVSPIFSGMQTGLFMADRGKLVHSAQTENGKLFLNGHEVVFN